MPHDCTIHGIVFRRSRSACIRIGHIAVGYIVVNVSGRVGCIVGCWQRVSDELIELEVDVYPVLNDDMRFVSKSQSFRGFFNITDLVDTVFWIEDSPGILRISIPPALLYRES